ncbi:MAG: transglycosylase SLT domain-containing protein [Myxococcota bacterium]|nr:transglycosylase SLT domain-containing protein [Myxococcota bacterium]
MLLSLCLPALAAIPSPADGPLVALPLDQLELALPLPPATHELLAERSHSRAISALESVPSSELSGAQHADLAFLQAWSLVRAGKAADAADLLEALQKAPTPPQAYKDLTAAEILAATGQEVAAAQALEAFDPAHPLWPRAMLVRAGALRDAGRTADAREVYESLAARPDPAEGSEVALHALAVQSGLKSEASYTYDRRLWAAYPLHAEGKTAAERLSEYGPYPTWQETALRADRLMAAGKWTTAIDTVVTSREAIPTPGSGSASPEACMAWYAHGRALFKLNRVTEASRILGPAGRDCQGHDDDRGAKALYLAGKSLERKKAWAAAAVEYAAIAELYPDNSYADDGLALAGIAWQEAGDLGRARQLWADQVARYPEGDLAGEGYWRLAWGAYLDGETDKAIQWADAASEKVPLQVDPMHVRAAIYWSARWRAYPDLGDPTALSGDEQAVAQAVEIWLEMCRESPFSHYTMLAAARLQELDPDALTAIPRWQPTGLEDPWKVRQSWLEQDSTQEALALARLGLLKDARVHFGDLDAMLPSEAAVVTELRWEADDWLMAHYDFKRFLAHHPPELLGEQQAKILTLGFPQQYWEEVGKATADYDWDGRLFHALTREESTFNKDIVSWAGAIGLSQLMPATAQGQARRMGLSVSKSDLRDPYTNARIGANYFDWLMKRFDGNHWLALAGYNAGEGNVDKWLSRFGNLPTDQFIESIPFRETRNYSRRVSRSWQTYHLLYDGGPAFPDRKAYNHAVKPAP